MKRVMGLLIGALGGCALVSEGRYASDLDPDGDGVPYPHDCDDTDPSVGADCAEADDGAEGEGEGEGVTDRDGDGIPADEDCDDDDASIGRDCTAPWARAALDDLAQTRVDGFSSTPALVFGIDDPLGGGEPAVVVTEPLAEADSGASRAGATWIFVAPPSGAITPAAATTELRGDLSAARSGAAIAWSSSASSCPGGHLLAIGSPQSHAEGESTSGRPGGVHIETDLGGEDRRRLGWPEVTGEADGDELGTALVMLGTADTLSLVAGAPGMGGTGGVASIRRVCSDLTIVWASGVQEGERAGAALATLTPADGGMDQLLVGAPGHDASAGAIYHLTTPLDGSSLDQDGTAVLVETDTGAGAGTALATGDVDGDGVDDVVIGAPWLSGVGGVRVVRSTDLRDDDLQDAAWATLLEQETGRPTGASVAVVEDVDGEGTPALLIGSCPLCEDPLSAQEGRVYAVPLPLVTGTHLLGDADLLGDAVDGSVWTGGPGAGGAIAALPTGGVVVGSGPIDINDPPEVDVESSVWLLGVPAP